METIVYGLLNADTALEALVGEKIFPTVPTVDTLLPIVVYTVTSAEPQIHLRGDAGLTLYGVQIDTWAVNLDSVLNVLNAVKGVLHCTTTASVKGSFLTAQNTVEEEAGFHGTQTYNMWLAA